MSGFPAPATIYFNFCCKKSATKCLQIMCTALGANIVSNDTVQIWYWKLKNKDSDIQEAEHSGWPTDIERPPCKNCRNEWLITGELSSKSTSCTMQCINLMCKSLGATISWLKHIRTNVLRPALICLNIISRTKFWTGSSLVIKSGFASTTSASSSH